MGQTYFNCGLGLLGAAALLLLIFAIRRLKYDASKMAADDDDELEVTIPGQEATVTLTKAPKPVKVLRVGIDYEDDEDWAEDNEEDWAADEANDADTAPAEPETAQAPAVIPAEPAAEETEAAPGEEAPADAEPETAPDDAQAQTESTAQQPAQTEADAAAHDDAVAESAETVTEADNSGENAPDEKEGVVSE